MRHKRIIASIITDALSYVIPTIFLIGIFFF